MNIFTFVWVAICVTIGVVTGILIAKVLILEDKQRELEREVCKRKQDVINFKCEVYSQIKRLENDLKTHKDIILELDGIIEQTGTDLQKQIDNLEKVKETNYDWLCEMQDDLDDLKRWSSDIENDLNNTMNSLSEVREATSYRGY